MLRKIYHFRSRDLLFHVSKSSLSRVAGGRVASAGRTRIDESIDPAESILVSSCDANYLGIDATTDHEIVSGYVARHNTQQQKEELLSKYDELLNKKKRPASGKKVTTSFGHVRLDSDNVARFHGQYEANQVKIRSFDEINRKIASTRLSTAKDQNILQQEDALHSMKVPVAVDERIEPSENSRILQSLITTRIDFRYPENEENEVNSSSKSSDSGDWLDHRFAEMEKRSPKNSPKIDQEYSTDSSDISDKLAKFSLEESSSQESSDLPESSEDITALEYLRRVKSGKLTAHFQEDYDVMNSVSKKKKLALDSKGYKILRNQLPEYSQMTSSEILQMLKHSVVFENDNFIALNKPYGFAMQRNLKKDQLEEFQEPEEDPKVPKVKPNKLVGKNLSLTFFLPEFAEMFGASKLYTVHRLDRDTTGVLLLAKSQPYAKILHDLFLERRIQKRYLAITKNVPDLLEGVIDIPIETGFIKTPDGQKRERAILCPDAVGDIRAQRRSTRATKRALTHYRVLSQRGNAAVLEIKPETGVKHQIRVHLGFGLRCPILGDHKYSSLDSLAPQKLPSDILSALSIRQQKVRHVPMHLHAHEIVIPEAGNNGTNIFIRAPLPYHFRKNLSSLKLKLN